MRALAGFSRIFAPHGGDGEQANIVSIYEEEIGWLPGIEVKGEGLFIRLEDTAVNTWAETICVKERVALLADRDKKRHEVWGIAPERDITARFLLVHVLAHALINQLALDAGYPAASLRERLFVDDGHCGLLVYTATTDSAGSLGGLVSRGLGDSFETLLRDALSRFSWCSSDPVCIESRAAGVDSLNLAACHSCALLPETSCEEMNSFLDRALLVGTPEETGTGFFEGLH